MPSALRTPDGSSTPRRRWLAFAAWAAAIYLTIPLARWIEATVGGVIGRDGFAVLGLGAVVLGLGGAATFLLRSGRLRSPAQAGWLVAVGIAYFVYGATQLVDPIETLHFLQYGLLGVLANRALAGQDADRSVYLQAALVCALVGTGDEIIQWLTPRRYFEFRDIGLNMASAGFAQAAIWGGLRPVEIRGRWGSAGLARSARLLVAWILLLALLASATPQRLAAAGRFLPALGRLADNPSVAAEYGFRIEDPEIGVFFSRLEPEELGEQDLKRASEAAATLDAYRAPERYPTFLADVPSWRDAFVHEARVHLFRRDRYRDLSLGAEDSAARRRAATVAWRENRILEVYFPRTLAASSYPWPPAERDRIRSLNDPGFRYESAVGEHLVTRFDADQVLLASLLASAALLAAERWLRGRSRTP